MQAHLKNTDRNAFFSLNIASVKEVKGFPEDYIYQVGDSIIKKSGEKEFTIKRGKNIAVFILDCDD
ncbi:hypothetical protein FFF34_012785 [Inquilinus sp. KBS0705]|nr:hypothetical protein FFF34_012785 [Inquilinus sp. KBS0705]